MTAIPTSTICSSNQPPPCTVGTPPTGLAKVAQQVLTAAKGVPPWGYAACAGAGVLLTTLVCVVKQCTATPSRKRGLKSKPAAGSGGESSRDISLVRQGPVSAGVAPAPLLEQGGFGDPNQPLGGSYAQGYNYNYDYQPPAYANWQRGPWADTPWQPYHPDGVPGLGAMPGFVHALAPQQHGYQQVGVPGPLPPAPLSPRPQPTYPQPTYLQQPASPLPTVTLSTQPASPLPTGVLSPLPTSSFASASPMPTGAVAQVQSRTHVAGTAGQRVTVTRAPAGQRAAAGTGHAAGSASPLPRTTLSPIPTAAVPATLPTATLANPAPAGSMSSLPAPARPEFPHYGVENVGGGLWAPPGQYASQAFGR